MISAVIVENHTFLLNTANTSYLFRIDRYGHPEHIHYGAKVSISDAEALSLKRVLSYGEATEYEDHVSASWRDVVPLEWSSSGIGDFREKPLEVHHADGTTLDFRYSRYEIHEGTCGHQNALPDPCDGDATLILVLDDPAAGLSLDLIYTVYSDTDVITRRAVLRNNSEQTVSITRMMSFSMDMIESDLVMMTFNGGWAREMQKSERDIVNGTFVSQADHGASSSNTNPGFILRKKNTTEYAGKAWGFNLVYSGNHYASVSCDHHGSVRIMQGLHPARLNRPLHPGEIFETPTAVMTFSDRGLNDLSHHFHDFINHHIVRTDWKLKERPVLVNNWEAYMFDFDEEKLVTLAQEGKRLGAELFVLDDGWFGARNNDRAGLGDYNVNTEKLPDGIKGLADKIHGMDMLFGLWFEPEAVNPDSDLFRAHPDWAISDTGYHNLMGRHEFLLDLTREEVREYIIDHISRILDEGNIDYVKWDMNRHMTAKDQSFAYDYICGLYTVLHGVFDSRPHILLESCSSGGNRFDLGMLCFSPQTWASDNTDPVDRFAIQHGYSYLYPQSTVGAHVSACPHAQTQRMTPLQTRFHTAAFGAFGYELDLRILSDIEKKEIRNQIAFYKQYRNLFQFGTFYRQEADAEHMQVNVTDQDGARAVSAVYRTVISAASPAERMSAAGLKKEKIYEIKGRDFLMPVQDGGPFAWLAEKTGILTKEKDGSMALAYKGEQYTASGAALSNGILLANVSNGSGYNPQARVPADFGSELYVIEEKKEL